MLTRNLAATWTNGRRVVVRFITQRIVEVVAAEAWRGPHARYSYHQRFCVPRIPFDWKHGKVGMVVERMQFPLQLAYATTFNKAQGKTLARAVVDVRVPVFAHGQLYVALSRVRGRDCIRLLCEDPQKHQSDALGGNYTSVTNVVERAMLERTMPQADLPAWLARYPVPDDPPPVAAGNGDAHMQQAGPPRGGAQAAQDDDVDGDAEAEAAEAEAAV